jgi:hypothetical protein
MDGMDIMDSMDLRLSGCLAVGGGLGFGMHVFRKILGVGVFVALTCSGLGATNEYYTSAEVKRIVDGVIKEYGGEEKMTGFERIKALIEMKEGTETGKMTFYEARGKARLDVTKGRVSVSSMFDGRQHVTVVNGKVAPTTPEAAKDQLSAEAANGVFQAELIDLFRNKDHQVLYRGKKKYDGKEYEVIETTDKRGKKKEHYIDLRTNRRMVEVKHEVRGLTAVVVEAFDEYEGVLYEKRVTFKGSDGSVRGSGRIVALSKDFGDDVFSGPK